jgi:4-diphosphocytidyl-2C-methyl-D-erythritol kinase
MCDKMATLVTLQNGSRNQYREITMISEGTYGAFAPAKLNIHLRIGKYDPQTKLHEKFSLMQTVELCDHVTLTKVAGGDESIEGPYVTNNIIAKTMTRLSKEVDEFLPARIILQKTIPMFAGMGGGSSDSAAVMRLANKAFGLKLTPTKFMEIARDIGDDVSFLIRGGRAQVDGAKNQTIGNQEVPDRYYLIARPHMKLSTERMYKLHDETGKDFSVLACELCPTTAKLMTGMRSGYTELGVTGKGPTVFAAYYTYKEAQKAAQDVVSRKLTADLFIARSMGTLL